MARGESPFQGRYVVPDVDFSAIERGGAAWGEAFKGIGQQIEKYGLKKEQQKKDKGTLKGIIQTLDTVESTDTSHSAHGYAAEKADLEDEERPLSERLAQGEERLSGMNISSIIKHRQMGTDAMKMANQLSKETISARKDLVVAQAENANIKNALNQLNLDVQPEVLKAQLQNLQSMQT